MGFSGYHVCYHCEDRTYDCHAKCELYKKEKIEMEKKRKEKNIKGMIDNCLITNNRHRIKSMKQKNHIH